MRHLFMQDSEDTPTLRQLTILIFAMFIVLIAIDRLFGFLIPHITIEPPLIVRFQTERGISKLWDLSAEGIQTVVFTGSSEISWGLSPHAFNDQIKISTGQNIESVNISEWGGVATIQHDLIKNLFIPNHAKVIIYGIEARALNAKDPYSTRVADFRNKPLGYAMSRPSDIERNMLLWLLQHSSLAQYRDNLRDWLTGTRGINQLDYNPSAEDELGHFIDPSIQDRDPNTIKGGDGFLGFTPFRADALPQQELRDIATSCKQNDTQCILLNMPLHEMAYQYISEADETLYQNVIHSVRLPVWDFNTKACWMLLGDTSFYNLNHLNERGAQIFSRIVADTYANVFLNVPISKDATCGTLSK